MFCSSGSSPVPGDEEQTCGKRVPGSVRSLARPLGTIRKTPALPRPFHSSPGNQVRGHSRHLETRVHRPWEPGDCWAHWGEYSDQSLPAPWRSPFRPTENSMAPRQRGRGCSISLLTAHTQPDAGSLTALEHAWSPRLILVSASSCPVSVSSWLYGVWGAGGSGDQFAPASQGEVSVRFDSSPLGSHRHSLLAFC